MRAHRGEAKLRESSNACLDVQTRFWEALALRFGQFGALFQFADGLAFIFPDTTIAGAFFSPIGYEKNQYCQSLIDFSLKGILYTTQIDTLRDLSTQ